MYIARAETSFPGQMCVSFPRLTACELGAGGPSKDEGRAALAKARLPPRCFRARRARVWGEGTTRAAAAQQERAPTSSSSSAPQIRTLACPSARPFCPTHGLCRAALGATPRAATSPMAHLAPHTQPPEKHARRPDARPIRASRCVCLLCTPPFSRQCTRPASVVLCF